MRRNTGILVVLLVGAAAAAGYFLWQKTRKHEVVLAVSAADCRGSIHVEENVWQDDKSTVKKEHDTIDDKGPTSSYNFTSETYRYPAGTVFSVLARANCKQMSCLILIDHESAGSGRAEGGQVSCTAMVGR